MVGVVVAGAEAAGAVAGAAGAEAAESPPLVLSAGVAVSPLAETFSTFPALSAAAALFCELPFAL